MTGEKAPVIFKIGDELRRRRRRHTNGEFSFRTRKISFNRKNITRGILNWIVLIFVAIIIGYAIVTFFVQTATVVGPSMNDTLSDGDTVIINKIVYTFNDIKRYDIVAFKKVDTSEYYEIKRVIALPGETVQIKDGILYINGQKLDDVPIDERILMAGVASREITLSEDEYFVMGDNVNNSEDSRYINVGNISKSEIIGRISVDTPKEK